MKILIVSDAWLPQINGVVRTLHTTSEILRNQGHEVELLTPDLFKTFPCPTYPEIRLAYNTRRKLPRIIEEFDPDCIHIATEGPLGWQARRYCLKQKLDFTTSFHTKFPEYLEARFHIPTAWSYKLLQNFHNPAQCIMVTTPNMQCELNSRGFKNLVIWSRGVDVELFHPRDKNFLSKPRPVFMYVGRVAVEKNLEAFLSLDLPGSKYVVGEGPQLESLQRQYPDVHFTGTKVGEELAHYYASADVFVFPSRTDTFGLVLLEALASGVPVAAYPVAGPVDVIGDSGVGCLDENLRNAALEALKIPAKACREHALKYTWRTCTKQFFQHLCCSGNF